MAASSEVYGSSHYCEGLDGRAEFWADHDEPWPQAIKQLGVILHSVAGVQELGGDREEPLWSLEHDFK